MRKDEGGQKGEVGEKGEGRQIFWRKGQREGEERRERRGGKGMGNFAHTVTYKSRRLCAERRTLEVTIYWKFATEMVIGTPMNSRLLLNSTPLWLRQPVNESRQQCMATK